MTDDLTIVETKPEHRLGIIHAKNPHDVIVQASAIAKELAGIIKANNLTTMIKGREYVQVEGWSTMGAMLGVLPREVCVQRQEDGGYEAIVELVRITDNVVIGRASASVGMDEVWGNRAEYARRSMAITRAVGKAYRMGFSWIMGLAGFAPTPAEEMVDGEYHDAPPPAEQTKAKTTNGKHSVAARPLSPESLADFLNKKAATYVGRDASEKQHSLFSGMMDTLVMGDDDKRKTIMVFLFGVPSRKDVPPELVLAALDWLRPTKDSGGAFSPDPMAVKEAEAVWTASLKTEGQQELL